MQHHVSNVNGVLKHLQANVRVVASAEPFARVSDVVEARCDALRRREASR